MENIVVLYNGGLSGGVFENQYRSYINSFEKLGVSAFKIPTEEYISALFNDEADLVLPETAIFLDKDIYAATLLENKGVKLYNGAECIRICDDKALTYIKLFEKGLPIPETIIAPKIYSGVQNISWCKKAAEKLGYPLVIKECFGSLGKQVYLAEDENELLEIVSKIGTNPFVLQKFFENGAGWDIRVIVLDGEVIGAIKRSNQNDFRSNAAIGGEATALRLEKMEKDLAIAAAEVTGAFFAGVDLIMGDNGFAICEVNSNMLFDAAEKALGFSVSDIIAEKIKKHSLNK